MAFSILQDMYKDAAAAAAHAAPSPTVANPFLPILLSAFEHAGVPGLGQQHQHPALFAERLFVAELLINPQAMREVRSIVARRHETIMG